MIKTNHDKLYEIKSRTNWCKTGERSGKNRVKTEVTQAEFALKKVEINEKKLEFLGCCPGMNRKNGGKIYIV